MWTVPVSRSGSFDALWLSFIAFGSNSVKSELSVPSSERSRSSKIFFFTDFDLVGPGNPESKHNQLRQYRVITMMLKIS